MRGGKFRCRLSAIEGFKSDATAFLLLHSARVTTVHGLRDYISRLSAEFAVGWFSKTLFRRAYVTAS